MNTLPVSIEDHLKEVGFNTSEILVLRHLLDGQHYTVRELAAKTGKSTGLVDQCVKRLLHRRLLKIVHANNTHKYALHSLESVAHYIKKHFNEHVSTVKRRSDDLSAFFSSLQLQTGRPVMEYFDGERGIDAMFNRLKQELKPGEQLLSYMLIVPEVRQNFGTHLDDFALFRRKYNIPLKVLTHSSHEAKRYHSRDHLFLRETRFITPDRCLLYIEHLLTEHAYYCIDYRRNTAQMIVYKELLAEMRTVFMTLWNDTPAL